MPFSFEKIVMSDDQRIAYVRDLLDGKVQPHGVEGDILKNLKLASEKLRATSRQITQIKQQLTKAAELEISLAGQCTALSELLCDMKEKRDSDQMKEKKVAQLEVNK